MKRTGNLIQKIAEPENLRLAFWKARKGKEGKREVCKFRQNLEKNLLFLREQLLTTNVIVGKYNYFTIFDPKEREICAASFSERVLHHALMNICHENFDKFQIFDSYASRPGKGTYAALYRSFYFQKKYNWFLKLDVRKYFNSIDHHILMKQLSHRFKDMNLLKIFNSIIECHNVTINTGLPIGNLTSQYFANHYLSVFDHFVKEKLKVPAYVRYMDDMVFWHNKKDVLLVYHKKITEYIEGKLNLSLKPMCLNSSIKGLPFLGYLVYPDKIRLAQRSKKRFRKKIKLYFEKYNDGIWDQANLQRSILPLVSYTEHAESQGFRKYELTKINGHWPWVLTA